jgi:hypothetical protein
MKTVETRDFYLATLLVDAGCSWEDTNKDGANTIFVLIGEDDTVEDVLASYNDKSRPFMVNWHSVRSHMKNLKTAFERY